MTDKRIGFRVLEPTGDGPTDTAALTAWVNASPRPPLFLAPNGNRLIIETALPLVSSGHYQIEGNGAEIVHKYSAAVPLLNVQRSMATPQDVCAAIDAVDFDISGTSSLTLVTRVTLSTISNVANYPLGSHVLVSSEDVAPHASIAENGRMGQVLRVAKVDPALGYVWFSSLLWRYDLYTTDIRITGFPVGETSVNNVKLSVEAASGEDIELRTSPVMWFQNCSFLSLSNIDILESCSSGIVLSRVFGGRIVNSRIRKLKFGTLESGPTNSRAGYGIFMTACDSMLIANNFVTNCRHSFTTNWTNASASGQTWRHGPVMNCLFADNVAFAMRGAGFDCHSDAIHCTFAGNTVYGSRSDSSGGGYGYQVRGVGNTLIGNHDYGCETGVQIFENTIDGTQEIVVQGHVSRSKKVGLVFSGNASSTRKLDARIIDSYFETSQVPGAAGKGMQFERARVNFKNTTVKLTGQDGGTVFNVVGAGITDISGTVDVDLTGAAGSWTALATAGTGNRFVLRTTRDSEDVAPGDAAYVVTDVSPDVVSFATTLTADRAVTFSVSGRKRVLIKRTAAGAFNLNITHAGGVLALTADTQAALFEVDGASAMLVSPLIELAP